MHQTLDFCLWKVMWWEQQAYYRTIVSFHLQEGLVAYVTENVAAEHRLISWSIAWAPIYQLVAQVLESYLKDW